MGYTEENIGYQLNSCSEEAANFNVEGKNIYQRRGSQTF
jgi:hypothetical protein